MEKVIRLIMIFVYGFLALGAFISGGMLISDPSGGSMGLSKDLLNHTPFQNYFIPGILLFSAIGLLQLISAFKLKSGGPHLKEIAFIAAVSMLIWIVVQLILIGYVFFLQAIILSLSIIELFFSIYLRKKK
ncbi:MAG: hypothetical protein K0R71_858 [Bacillales bacterium]|jgi:hypothetical protein|nr:hypothetical protein [Bacillales bacterium]